MHYKEHILNDYYEKKKRKSAILSLKEILVIITGLTITNAVIVLIAKGNYQAIKPIYQLNIQEIIIFILLILNIVRFYHGNMRLLDDSYLLKESTYLKTGECELDDRVNYIFWDYFVILLTGIMFAFMSFFLSSYLDFFLIFITILIIDVAWYFFTNKDTLDSKIKTQRKFWTLNNVAHLFILIPLITVSLIASDEIMINIQNRISLFYVLTFLTFTNAIADFYVSWEFYFPSKCKDEEEKET